MHAENEAPGAPAGLRCNSLTDPLGLDDTSPRLSWQVNDPRIGAVQTAYQIQVAGDADALETGARLLWDTGKVASDGNLDVPYRGVPCKSWTRCAWRVRTWDAGDVASPWSAPARWELGPLSAGEWHGAWIGSAPRRGTAGEPCPYLRGEIDLRSAPVSARLAVTARGDYEIWINAARVGDDCFTPGWTDYDARIPFQVYDVTSVLAAGRNALGAILADGWYAGHLMTKRNSEKRCVWGKDLSLLVTLRITYSDGSVETFGTDANWRWAHGAFRAADHYDGEHYDARQEPSSWRLPGFDDSEWEAVTEYPAPGAALVAKTCPNVRRIEERSAQRRTEPVSGRWVYDFGQNMVGRIRLRPNAPAGTIVTIRHAEMLEQDGTLHTANLRGAECTDTYVCRGGAEELYEPRFTFHGFRYAEVSGCPEAPPLDCVTGIVLHSDLPETGRFQCSNDLVNRLQSNIRWGQKGNFLEVPTDCPQRDERLGWTGDAQVFARTACFNMDVAAFFAKYCQDMEDAQTPEGSFPHVAPDTLQGNGSAAWADAGVIVPWTVYLCYGDVAILDRYFEAMARWVDFMERESDGLIRPEQGFGDWLSIDGAQPGSPTTPKSLIGTAYFARCAGIVARAADLLGRSDRAAKYQGLRDRVVDAFNNEFVTPSGRLAGHSQTAYLLALAFDLLPPEKRDRAAAYLVADIERRNAHLSTGFVGTPLLCPVLTKIGRTDLAYRLLLQETYPSWFKSVLSGATTMWERWNSYTPERGLHGDRMNSFNHYAYGAIGAWLYATVGGLDIDVDAPGYKRSIIAPQPGGELTWAEAELETRYGRLACRWELADGALGLTVVVPANTSAILRIPIRNGSEVRLNGAPAAESPGVSHAHLDALRFECELAAGRYSIREEAAANREP